MRRNHFRLASFAAIAVMIAACNGDDLHFDGVADDDGSASSDNGSGAGGPGSGAGGPGSGAGGPGSGAGGQGGGGTLMHGDDCDSNSQCASGACIALSCCGNHPGEDNDQDGFSASEGDCNDCEAATNPAAYDVINTNANGMPLPTSQQVDEDCSGAATLPSDPSCDTDPNLTLDSSDPLHGAMALDLCQAQSGDAWGVISASYKQIDGTALPATTMADLGHGILDNFGQNVSPEKGAKMLSLSTGVARRPTDPGYEDLGTADKAYSCQHAPGVPFNSTSCPNILTGMPYDSIVLSVDVRVPSNATEASFAVKFYTYEFPNYICSEFNDIFLATMLPARPGASPPNTNNVTFDNNGEPLSVNNVLLDVCSPQTAGGKPFTCPAGIAELAGTGFEQHAATSWLTTTVPVTGEEDLTVEFGIMDAGDGVLSSTVLVDAWTWTATQGEVVVHTN